MEKLDFILRTIVIIIGFVLILAGYIPSAMRENYSPGGMQIAIMVIGVLCIAAGASY